MLYGIYAVVVVIFPFVHTRDEVFGESEHEKNDHDKETGIEIPDPTYKQFGRVLYVICINIYTTDERQSAKNYSHFVLKCLYCKWKKCDEFFFVQFITVFMVRSLIFSHIFLYVDGKM